MALMTDSDLVAMTNSLLQQIYGDTSNIAIDISDYVQREYKRICVTLGITRKMKLVIIANPPATSYALAAITPTGLTASDLSFIASVKYYDLHQSFPLEHRDYRDVRQSIAVGAALNTGTCECWGFDDAITGKEFCVGPLGSGTDKDQLEINWVYIPADMPNTGTPDPLYPHHLADAIAIQAAVEALRTLEEYEKADNLSANMLAPKLKMIAQWITDRYYVRSFQREGHSQ